MRSFVRRNGRITSAQTRALDRLLDRFAVPARGVLHFSDIFDRLAPISLEIGSGNGECIAAFAGANPANNYLAVEVHRPGVGHLLNLAANAAIDNLRVAIEDVWTLLPRIKPDSLATVYIFFPDPWPKARHHKRRLLQADFFAALRPCMQRHGRVYIA
ncbi:MAG: tRNA (guanine(46)-N(7))-methyltransferase TrmB, partial [Gammaproteobacteria bacterium]